MSKKRKEGAHATATKRSDVTRLYRPKSDAEINRNMSAIRSTNNATEMALRKSLHAKGLRYRKYTKDLPGKPDIVFRSAQVAVFVDGDFWHARVMRERGVGAMGSLLRTPKQAYWIDKFTRRIEIDDATSAALEKMGWLVVRLWESDVKRDVERAASEIARFVRSRTPVNAKKMRRR